MANNGTIDEGRAGPPTGGTEWRPRSGDQDAAYARAALDSAHRASDSARVAGRHWIRRYLLGFGAAAALAVIPVWALSYWMPQPVLWFVCFLLFLSLLGAWSRRQRVRVRLPRLVYSVLIPAWAVVFGLTVAIGPEAPVAYPIGAVTGFAVWAAGAWWVGRGEHGGD